jgi:hypothetical protein
MEAPVISLVVGFPIDLTIFRSGHWTTATDTELALQLHSLAQFVGVSVTRIPFGNDPIGFD